ncbi:MAG TPA: hypothetical protein VH370_06875 [Humisphaera sp.]|jgi:hypothetical protein|nr:hypothetical protein [Humisphaera sp.]
MLAGVIFPVILRFTSFTIETNNDEPPGAMWRRKSMFFYPDWSVVHVNVRNGMFDETSQVILPCPEVDKQYKRIPSEVQVVCLGSSRRAVRVQTGREETGIVNLLFRRRKPAAENGTGPLIEDCSSKKRDHRRWRELDPSRFSHPSRWGAPSMLSVANPKSDYGRAGAATANAQMGIIPVGSTSALIFADPPMTAWGTSADGLVEVYYLKSWTGMNLDALIAKATLALPTASLTNSGNVLQLHEPDAFLLFAGDTPSSTAYGVHRVKIPAGKYNVLVGTYTAAGESVTIYRLQPAGT